MALAMLLCLTLALATIAFAQHGHHGRPFSRRSVHGGLANSTYTNGYSNPTSTSSAASTTGLYSSLPNSSCSYWLEDIRHQGLAPFSVNPSSYQVFRNVKDFGAVGDGIADDTAAINTAISSGGRCSPLNCESSTTTPAIVYFPPGTYLVNSSIIVFYETQLIGNPSCLPIIRAARKFQTPPNGPGFVVDGDLYRADGRQGFGSTNTFYRQIRNLVIDMTLFPADGDIRGIHWPTAQATSLQNVVFEMSDAPGTKHQGVYIENGSGGFLADLVFNGGLFGSNWGNQQFTTRNLTFNNAVTAIYQAWDWGWTYKSITINNCSTGLDMTSIDSATGRPNVGSITFIDSSISDTPIGIANSRGPRTQPPTAGSLIIENVDFANVSTAVSAVNGLSVPGFPPPATQTLAGFGTGHIYNPNGPINFDGVLPGFSRPASLLQNDGKYYERSKPQYAGEPLEEIYSVRNAGAKGDGVTDDTATLQRVINMAAYLHKIVFFDFGVYKVTRTLNIPAGSRIVGETYSVILSSGKFFANIRKPQIKKPVVQIGRPGDKGTIEWSDMVVSTQGSQAGAILIEINLESPPGSPSGLWDVHTRIGGFAGSYLQLDDCPKTPNTAIPPFPVNRRCVAAFLALHLTKQAAGVYLENVWLWTADHDLDDPSGQNTQITIYTGRGLLIDSERGPVWLVGTAVEHFQLYQYQFANTKNIFAGQIQTETAYYQPNPNATLPFLPVASFNDPNFKVSSGNNFNVSSGNNFNASSGNNFNASSGNATRNTADGWGLRILNSDNVLIYGAGLYSFFDNYNSTCAAPTDTFYCQSRILTIEGAGSNVNIYNLNTVGSSSMADRDGSSIVAAADNVNGFPDTVALLTVG